MVRELTIKELCEVYTEYNEAYFDNELPPVEQVTIEYSNRLTSSAGVCYRGKKLIRLSTHYAEKYGEEEVKSVLLHEMIHLQIRGHGQKFHAKLRDIQSKGGNVSRYSKGVAKTNWEYTCIECGTKYKRSIRLSRGGKHHVCGKCKSKLREWRVV